MSNTFGTPPSKRGRQGAEDAETGDFEHFVDWLRSLKLDKDNAMAEVQVLSEEIAGRCGEKSKPQQDAEREELAKKKPLPENIKLEMTLHQIGALVASGATFEVSSAADGGVTVKIKKVSEDHSLMVKGSVARPLEKKSGLVLWGLHAGAAVTYLGPGERAGTVICKLPRGHKATSEEDSLPDVWTKDQIKILDADQIGVHASE